MSLRRTLGNLRWAVRLSFLYFRFQWSIRAMFKTGVLLSIANSALGLLSWFFIGSMFRMVQVSSLENYDQNYLAYIMVGSFISTVFGAGGFFNPSGFFQRDIFGPEVRSMTLELERSGITFRFSWQFADEEEGPAHIAAR